VPTDYDEDEDDDEDDCYLSQTTTGLLQRGLATRAGTPDQWPLALTAEQAIRMT
jgi:hypothetical protein